MAAEQRLAGAQVEWRAATQVVLRVDLRAARQLELPVALQVEPLAATRAALRVETRAVLPVEMAGVLEAEMRAVLPAETRVVPPAEMRAVLPAETRVVLPAEARVVLLAATRAVLLAEALVEASSMLARLQKTPGSSSLRAGSSRSPRTRSRACKATRPSPPFVRPLTAAPRFSRRGARFSIASESAAFPGRRCASSTSPATASR